VLLARKGSLGFFFSYLLKFKRFYVLTAVMYIQDLIYMYFMYKKKV